MEKNFKLIVSMMPNHITIDIGDRYPGAQTASIPINSLSEAEAIEYGEAMKNEFLKHWKVKTEENEKQKQTYRGPIKE